MNYLKRVFLSVWERKGKNLLLIIAFCVIATLMLACISIRTAATKAENDAKTKIGSSVTVEPDRSKEQVQTFSDGNSASIDPPITKDMLDKLSKIPHVKSVNYETGGAGEASGFDIIGGEMQQQVHDELKSKGLADANITVNGERNTSKLDKFMSSGYKLTSGRHINEADDGKDVTMIEETLADKNGLKIGDKIKILCIGDQGKLNGKSIELEIVGIFEAPAATGVNAMFTVGNPSDAIFTPISVTDEMDPDSSNVNDATCNLDSPLNIDFFKSEAAKVPGMDKFKLDTHDRSYQQMTGPLQNVTSFTNGMVIFIMIASCLILCLIVVLSVKNRGREFGILLAIGEKRLKIVMQVALEALLPMLIAVCLTIPFENVIAQGMGNSLLDAQVQSGQQQNQNNGNGITKNSDGAYVFSAGADDGSTKDVKPIDTINVVATPADYEKLVLLCLLIIVLSAFVPAASIYRLNPRAILIKNE